MLESKFLGIDFENPLVIPSGIIPEIADSIKAQAAGAGGVVTKSITVSPREGNPMPRVITYGFGILNSVGLRNPGLDKGIFLLKKLLLAAKIPVIVSIFAVSVADFKKLVAEVIKIQPKFIELNLSCPNTTNELGESMGMGTESTYAAVSVAKKIVGNKTKLIAKLSPNVAKISEVAKAAESAGADAISAINTVGPGMVIDIKTHQPKLGNKEGGVSGPGIRPVAIRCVYDIYESVNIPILGMGGVETGKDAVEMLMAGATLVGVGSAIYRHGFGVINKIKAEVTNYMRTKKIKSLAELVGVAHT